MVVTIQSQTAKFRHLQSLTADAHVLATGRQFQFQLRDDRARQRQLESPAVAVASRERHDQIEFHAILTGLLDAYQKIAGLRTANQRHVSIGLGRGGPCLGTRQGHDGVGMIRRAGKLRLQAKDARLDLALEEAARGSRRLLGLEQFFEPFDFVAHGLILVRRQNDRLGHEIERFVGMLANNDDGVGGQRG